MKHVVNKIMYTVLLLMAFFAYAFAIKPKPKLLLMTKTAGFYHSSIPKGIAAIQLLCSQNGWEVDLTKDSAYFTPKNLKQYSAIIFLSTTGTLFNENQRRAFKQYIQSGGGFVGIHAATDAEYEWPWYNKMIGAWFMNHPKQQRAKLIIPDKNHLATKDLPHEWERVDEWYNFKDINPNIKPLIMLDEKSYKGGNNGDFHPIAWYHQFEGGRVFYTGLGHTDESYSEPLFLQHLSGGIKYAMGYKN